MILNVYIFIYFKYTDHVDFHVIFTLLYYDDFKLKKSLWSPWFIYKIFSAVWIKKKINALLLYMYHIIFYKYV